MTFVQSGAGLTPLAPAIPANDAATPTRLSPATSPAAAATVKRAASEGKRRSSSHAASAPSAIVKQIDAGMTKARPKATALGA